MRRRLPPRAIPLVLAGLAAATLAGGCRRPAPAGAAVTPAPPEPTPVPVAVVLFFPGDDTLLHRESRELPDLPTAVPARARQLVSELLAGSRQGWSTPFPWPVSVEAVYQDGRGTVFLDLSAPPPGALAGTASELAMTYATINTLAANCPGVERVQLLFGGREVETFGHLALSRPLAPSPELVAP